MTLTRSSVLLLAMAGSMAPFAPTFAQDMPSAEVEAIEVWSTRVCSSQTGVEGEELDIRQRIT